MKYGDFIASITESKLEYELADTLYMKALEKLKDVRFNLDQLDDTQHIKRVIKPFLIMWGSMGRVVGGNFEWEKVGNILRGLKPAFEVFNEKSFLDVDFTEKNLSKAIEKIFQELRKLEVPKKKKIGRLGWTGISKIIHLVNPEIFVLWDDKIRDHYHKINLRIRGSPEGYLEFSREMQRQLLEALKDHQNETHQEITIMANELILNFDNKPLTKLCDEYNWIKIYP